jgi:hypothetical protein
MLRGIRIDVQHAERSNEYHQMSEDKASSALPFNERKWGFQFWLRKNMGLDWTKLSLRTLSKEHYGFLRGIAFL